MKTYYTLGFLFDRTLKTVVLLTKSKPAWQAGKMNGVGGHVEDNESPLTCMEREFSEEVKYPYRIRWLQYATMRGDDFEVFCFAAAGDSIEKCEQKTDEPIHLIPTENLSSAGDVVENLPWLVTLAIDVLQDGRPSYSYIEYP